MKLTGIIDFFTVHVVKVPNRIEFSFICVKIDGVKNYNSINFIICHPRIFGIFYDLWKTGEGREKLNKIMDIYGEYSEDGKVVVERIDIPGQPSIKASGKEEIHE